MVLILEGNSEIGKHGKEQSLLFDMLKAFKSSLKSDMFPLQKPIFFHDCATCSEIMSNTTSMV